MPILSAESLAPEEQHASEDVTVAAFVVDCAFEIGVERALQNPLEATRNFFGTRCTLPIPSEESSAPEEHQVPEDATAAAFVVELAEAH